MGRTTMICTLSAALLALSACAGGTGNSLAALDNGISAQDIDPAVTSVIEDEIMVDPALVQQANADAVRPPERPLQAQYPLPSAAGHGAAGGRAGAGGGQGAVPPGVTFPAPGSGPIAGACGAALEYGPEWAERLPAEFPPYPGGRVTEAAGNNVGTCRVRVVTFTTEHRWQQVIDWYRAAATRAGFNAEHQTRGADQLLGGVNERTDGAYVVVVTPTQSGSEVALIVNNGR